MPGQTEEKRLPCAAGGEREKAKHQSLSFGGSVYRRRQRAVGRGRGHARRARLERAGLKEKNAHATAIAVIAPASFLSGAVYLVEGLVPMGVFLPVALGVLLGGALGAKLLGKLSLKAVSLLFELVMFAAGMRLLLP